MLFLAALLSLLSSTEPQGAVDAAAEPQGAADAAAEPQGAVDAAAEPQGAADTSAALPSEKPSQRVYLSSQSSSFAVLPSGSNAWHLWFGAPEIGLGYRHGFPSFEFEARASFDYFKSTGVAEGAVKFKLLEKKGFILAPSLGLGLAASTGANHASEHNYEYNFKHVSMQPRLSLWLTYHALSPEFALVGLVDFPILAPLSGEGFGLRPTAGVGGVLYLKSQLSLMLLAGLGPEWIKPPSMPTACRLAWYVRLGIGFGIT
jgi:hypothetical protein